MSDRVATVDHVADFYRHMPAWARRALNPTQRVEHAVGVAVSRGWTTEQLASFATTGLEHHKDPGGVITYRLQRAGHNEPPEPRRKPRTIHHGCCDNGWRYDESTDPPTVTKCTGAT